MFNDGLKLINERLEKEVLQLRTDLTEEKAKTKRLEDKLFAICSDPQTILAFRALQKTGPAIVPVKDPSIPRVQKIDQDGRLVDTTPKDTSAMTGLRELGVVN